MSVGQVQWDRPIKFPTPTMHVARQATGLNSNQNHPSLFWWTLPQNAKMYNNRIPDSQGKPCGEDTGNKTRGTVKRCAFLPKKSKWAVAVNSKTFLSSMYIYIHFPQHPCSHFLPKHSDPRENRVGSGKLSTSGSGLYSLFPYFKWYTWTFWNSKTVNLVEWNNFTQRNSIFTLRKWCFSYSDKKAICVFRFHYRLC